MPADSENKKYPIRDSQILRLIAPHPIALNVDLTSVDWTPPENFIASSVCPDLDGTVRYNMSLDDETVVTGSGTAKDEFMFQGNRYPGRYSFISKQGVGTTVAGVTVLGSYLADSQDNI